MLKGFEDTLYIFLQSSKIKEFYDLIVFFLKIVFKNLYTKFGMAFYDHFKDKTLPILFYTYEILYEVFHKFEKIVEKHCFQSL